MWIKTVCKYFVFEMNNHEYDSEEPDCAKQKLNTHQ